MINYTTFKDKKEQFNAMNNSIPLKNYLNNVITVSAVVDYTQPNDEGEGEKHLIAMKIGDNEYCGSVSHNVMQAISSAMDAFGDITEENKLDFKVTYGLSKNDRNFLQLESV